MHRLVRNLALSLALAVSAQAGWTSVGDMPAPVRAGNALVFRGPQARVSVTAIAPEVIRVRFAPSTEFGRDHSYAIVDRDLGDPRATFHVEEELSTITTPALQVTLQHRPFRVSFADSAGNVLDQDDPEKGTAYSGRTMRVWKRLRDDEHVYGFGEKNGRLDKRGAKLGGYNYTMWNSDTYAYGTDTDPIYTSVPFFMVLREGATHGIFLDNTFRSNFDVGHELDGILSFGADGGELDYYFIHGPSPKQVIERYTALTGRMPLPPMWALGYHQSRWSYYPEEVVRSLAEEFRDRRIPADVLWLDIHYLDRYKPFTWDLERFPRPSALLSDLREQEFRVVTVIDPHPKKEPGDPVYEAGIAGDHFIRNADGSIYEAPVWPSQADDDPGPSVFPDFSREETRAWWGDLHGSLLDAGVAGIWNDMNEPAIFDTPSGTMPLDVRHHNEGEPTDHREIHNIYGMLQTRSTWEALRRLRPDERPFVLTRATFAGGQRYAAVWPGDNVADWTHLRGSLQMLLGMGISGLPFVGSDIGGFVGAPTAELYTRWLQFGVFNPFMRTHTSYGTPSQDPWSYGEEHEAINRRAIELRYELLPTLYDLMRHASVTGVPPLRPMFLEYPDDPRSWSMDDQFLFGRDILVAPVLGEGLEVRHLYLPPGDWYDYWTGGRHEGGGDVSVPVTLESIPMFVRGGGFVFEQPVVQSTARMEGQPLRVRVYPAANSSRSFYEDDGRSMDYRDGAFALRRFSQSRSEQSVVIGVSAPKGSYRPPGRSLLLIVKLDEERPVRVHRDAHILDEVAATDLEGQGEGWALRPDGFLVVRVPDRFETLEIVIDLEPGR